MIPEQPLPAAPCVDALLSARARAWRPGSPTPVRHEEIFAASGDAGGAALALALACDRMKEDERPFLWVQDKAALRLSGRPYRPGMPPGLRHRLVHVVADRAEDALFALEEGLRCRDLAFVIGELTGNPRALSFTASRRLSLAAERHGVPLWLVRLDAQRDLGSARMRWAVRSARSPAPGWNPQAPGTPSWRVELFRARNHPPGEWILCDDGGNLSACPSTGAGRAGPVLGPESARPAPVEGRAHG